MAKINKSEPTNVTQKPFTDGRDRGLSTGRAWGREGGGGGGGRVRVRVRVKVRIRVGLGFSKFVLHVSNGGPFNRRLFLAIRVSI